MTAQVPVFGPSPAAAAPVRRRRAPLVALLVGAAVLAAAGGAAAAWDRHEQAQLAEARSAREVAQSALDAALAGAEAGGVTAAQLQPVVAAERALLAEPAVPARLGRLDAGEVDHLRRQASALRQLGGRIAPIVRAVTDSYRSTADPMLARLDAAITAAHQAGLDPGDAAAALAAARLAVQGAATPAAIDAALAGLDARAAALTAAAAGKLASDQSLAGSHAQAAAALARADQLLAAAQRFAQLQLGDLAAAVTAQHQAYALADDVPSFAAVTAAAGTAADGLEALLAARSGAYDDMSQARQVVQQAASQHIDPGDTPARLDQIQARLDAAGTLQQLTFERGEIAAWIAPLRDRLGVPSLGSGKLIVVSLDYQELTAYQDGSPLLSTLVTTGRPALPTPPGSYTVLRKNHPWKMVSDFPPSSPFWYPPTWVQFTLWFRSDGYAIHDAPWRGTYGPGTQAAGSHGCINVPYDAEVQLYTWADVGTRVIVH